MIISKACFFTGFFMPVACTTYQG